MNDVIGLAIDTVFDGEVFRPRGQVDLPADTRCIVRVQVVRGSLSDPKSPNGRADEYLGRLVRYRAAAHERTVELLSLKDVSLPMLVDAYKLERSRSTAETWAPSARTKPVLRTYQMVVICAGLAESIWRKFCFAYVPKEAMITAALLLPDSEANQALDEILTDETWFVTAFDEVGHVAKEAVDTHDPGPIIAFQDQYGIDPVDDDVLEVVNAPNRYWFDLIQSQLSRSGI